MTYSNDQLEKIQTEYNRLSAKCDRLIRDYSRAGNGFAIERAREYTHHGFCRRLMTLEHCIVRVFETIPPDSTRQPNEHQIHDVTAFLQAFIFNVFGCIDNLAHIWVQERNVKKPDGTELPDSAVGFGRKNREVLNSLPARFESYITSPEYLQWCRIVGGFRNALAHRIPPYIPPFVVQKKDLSRFNEMGHLVEKAIDRGEFSDAYYLRKQQNEIGVFVPGLTHSFSEKSPSIWIHPQLLADFNTVEEVAQRLLDELCDRNRQPSSSSD